MKVGVIGSGEVAQALGAGFLKHGDAVMLGTREPQKLKDWLSRNPKGKVGKFDEAAAFGELIVVAVKGAAAQKALESAGAARLKGKVVIDAANPIVDEPPVNGVLKFFTSLSDSLMERLQKAFPDAKFVKAFNSVGADFMVNPAFKDGKPTMFICGNDDGAKKTVRGILDKFGWETEDVGKAEAARALEPLCILWCLPGFLRNDWTHAFKLLKA